MRRGLAVAISDATHWNRLLARLKASEHVSSILPGLSAAPMRSLAVCCRFDKGCIGDIEKALFNSDVGMTPNSDGKVIRLNVPQVTTERRKELSKLAKTLGEEGKVAIRNVRKGAIDKVKKLKKEIGEDACKDAQDELQAIVKKHEADVEKLVADREKDILTV